MKKMEVKLKFEVHCEGSMGDSYRLYLGKDLLTERTWRFPPATTYLIENAPLKLSKGEYDLRIETVQPGTGRFTIKNINTHNAKLIGDNRIQVQ